MIDTRALTKTPTQANLLRTILRLYESTRINRDGVPYLAVQLDRFAAMLGVRARSTIQRALRWLEANGFIQIVRDRWCRSPRLYIRPLVKPRATYTQRESNVTGCAGATCNHNTHEKENKIIGTASPDTVRMALRGSIEGAADRVQKKQEVTRTRAKGKPPAPKIIAREWSRLLAEYGYPRFDQDDPKHLRHIGQTIRHLRLNTVGEIVAELERRINLWQNKRPDRLKKTPPHPWAINRTHEIFEIVEDEPGELKVTDMPLPPAQELYDPSKDSDKTVPNVVKPKAGGLFAKKKLGKDGK